jgi:predicted AlkP superfamily phosphohydrolase/phosphomutase
VFASLAESASRQSFPVWLRRGLLIGLLFLSLMLLYPASAQAYIGPGAGFALAGPVFAVFAAIFSAFVMFLSWPLRLIARVVLRRKRPTRARVKRVVVLGLDGLDHGLTEKMLAEGALPNLARLRDQGGFRSLGSTLPPISPVAWSSFQTGVNPGKHNIFDFLLPDHRTYEPKLSSVEIRPPRRTLKIGKYRVPLGRGDVRLLRKSQPFWSILSDYGVFNCVLRVPITFPAEKLKGVQLSAMCVPDLRGTQGTFSHYTTKSLDEGEKTGGEVHVVARQGNTVRAHLVGPANPLQPEAGPLKLPFRVVCDRAGGARLHIDGQVHQLTHNEYTDWISVCFRAGFGTNVRGVCRFLLLESEPEFRLYVTPVNIDPERPAMPISYPSVYSVYLAKQQGPYATLGLAEDTWGLSEEVLEDGHFLEQCLATDREREAMFFDSLEKCPEGLCVCVFDGTDRMQHMFWRHLDEQHPARPAEALPQHRTAIADLYRRMDDLVARTMARCQDPGTLLLVISDHGFNTFRRGIDLNRWLEQEGYLKVDDSQRMKEHLAGVDWSNTRAFAIGLTGIFINARDRFSQGIVDSGPEADALRDEIARKLAEVVDPQTGCKAVKRVYQAVKIYRGPYKEQAPDLIVGYDRGYRVSWEAAIGRTSRDIFHDNKKAWSGDHCVDPSVVPGILFSNRPIATENPRLLDLAPTILDLFGITPPDYMDGKILSVGDTANSGVAATVQPAGAAT